MFLKTDDWIGFASAWVMVGMRPGWPSEDCTAGDCIRCLSGCAFLQRMGGGLTDRLYVLPAVV